MHRLGGVGSQNHQRGPLVLAKLMKTLIWHPAVPTGCVGEGLNERTMVPANTFFWERAGTLALTLKPDNSVSSHMSPAFFELLCSGGV